MTTLLPAVEAATRAAIARRTEQLFREAGALREGHFELTSGRHAESYLEKFQVLQWPRAVSELSGYLAARVRTGDGSSLVDVVCGPTTGGVILAFEVARQLGVRGIFAEEVRPPGGQVERVFRRGFRLEPGERVLLVDDILTTGGSLLAMLPPIESAGAELVTAGVMVDRTGRFGELNSPHTGRTYPLEPLWSLALATYQPGAGSCPGCAAGLPLDTPGGKATERISGRS